MPLLELLYTVHRDEGFVLLGLSVDRASASVVRAFVQQRGVTYPVAVVGPEGVAMFGGVVGYPTSFLIGRDGTVRHQVLGPLAPASLEPAVRRLLAERGHAVAGGADVNPSARFSALQRGDDASLDEGPARRGAEDGRRDAHRDDRRATIGSSCTGPTHGKAASRSAVNESARSWEAGLAGRRVPLGSSRALGRSEVRRRLRPAFHAVSGVTSGRARRTAQAPDARPLQRELAALRSTLPPPSAT
jgi:hypothetical protein